MAAAVDNTVVVPDVSNVVRKVTSAENVHKTVVTVDVADVEAVVADTVAVVAEVPVALNVEKKVTLVENAHKMVAAEAVVEDPVVTEVVAHLMVAAEAVAEVDVLMVEVTPELISLLKIKLLNKVLFKPILVLKNH